MLRDSRLLLPVEWDSRERLPRLVDLAEEVVNVRGSGQACGSTEIVEAVAEEGAGRGGGVRRRSRAVEVEVQGRNREHLHDYGA